MKYRVLVAACVMLAASFVFSAAAQAAPAKGAGAAGAGGDRKAQLMQRFDTNGDGQLSPAEKQAAMAAMQARRGNSGTGRPTAGKPGAGRPTAGRPTAGKPGAGRPTAGKPGAKKRPQK